ncbi:MAG: aminopeptidase P family protein [Candidatus Micrarchaeota archaeon]|nr:aminopeptidase P family protein [Candidatus Micrarchaeota archaeon]
MNRVFKDSKADAIVLINTNTNEQDPNFSYLTGFTSGLFEQNILIATRKSLILLTNALEYENAKRNRPKEMRVVLMTKSKQFATELARACKGKTVGINGFYLPYSYYRKIKELTKAKRVVDVASDFYRARKIKDDEEIRRIHIASNITKKAIKETQRDLKEGMSERDVAARFEYIIIKHGADGSAFPSCIQFGSNSALPHHMPDNTKLKPNSIVLLDVGARYRNYCADVTRTFIFKPDKRSEKYKKMKDMQDAVLGSQAAALKITRHGVSGKDIQTAAADFLNNWGKGRYARYSFPRFHELGHSIGIEVHDGPINITTKADNKVEENMIFSNEPGIYIVGFGGIRIEDDMLITKKGARFL